MPDDIIESWSTFIQVITWNSVDLSAFKPLEAHYNRGQTEVQTVLFKNIYLDV